MRCGSTSAGFSEGAKDVIDKFDFAVQIERMRRANVLYQVIGRFADIDLHPEVVSNIEMGYLYEELIRKFSEMSNETAGEHFTPREVIRLMVNLLFIDDADDILTKPGIVKTLCDPACGTGGMLSVAEDHLRALNPQARLEVFGQELNAETYAICRSDMMLKDQDASHIAYGNSFSEDHFEGERFDYLLANPPFGVEWKKVADEVKNEAQTKGFKGRFGAGLPRINDGSFLFLQHMISKMKRPEEGGSRVAIVFNGSPLFTGAAGSGESEIRRWIIENDWLEAVVALPDQLFYNTGISTYFWVVTNRKAPERRGQGSAGRCARVLCEDAQVAGREAQADLRPPRSGKSHACTATSPRASRSRSSLTRPLVSCGSRSSVRYGCAGRSPTRRSRSRWQPRRFRSCRRIRRRRSRSYSRMSEVWVSRRNGSWPRRSRMRSVFSSLERLQRRLCGPRWPCATRRPR